MALEYSFGFDIEYKGLSDPHPDNFVLGIVKSFANEKKYKCFRPDDINPKTKKKYKKKAVQRMWDYMIQRGETAHKNGKNAVFYSYKSAYDFFRVWDKNDASIRFLTSSPFRAVRTEERTNTYTNKKGEKFTKTTDLDYIYWMDIAPLWKGGVAKVGHVLSLEKLETPEVLYNKNRKRYTKKELDKIETYCLRDTDIVRELGKRIYYFVINETGTRIDKLWSLGTISGNIFLKKFVLTKPYKQRLTAELTSKYNGKPSPVMFATNKSKLHKAGYRGGRVQTFHEGIRHKNCISFDINSAYPFACTKIPFADLRSERIIGNPLNQGWTPEKLFSKIGTSLVLIKKKNENGIGSIPVRTNYHKIIKNIKQTNKKKEYNDLLRTQEPREEYPAHRCFIVGRYTHLELAKWLKDDLITIGRVYNSVIYDELIYKGKKQNPLKEMMLHYYKKRTKNEFDRKFIKYIMNNTIGKTGEIRKHQKQKIVPLNLYNKVLMESKGWKQEAKLGHGKVLFSKIINKTFGKYYSPIIGAYVCAYVRMYLTNQMKTIDYEDLLLTDTDSIKFKYKKKYLNNFEIGKGLGQWELEDMNFESEIAGRKAYAKIKENEWDIKISGIGKRYVTKKGWKEGKIKYEKMAGISKGIDEAGSFKKETRNLTITVKREKAIKELINNAILFIDDSASDQEKGLFFELLKDIPILKKENE
jgi:hypothetical protein